MTPFSLSFCTDGPHRTPFFLFPSPSPFHARVVSLFLSFSATEHGAHSAFPLSLFLPARRKKRRDLIFPLSPLRRTSPSRRLSGESADSTLFNPFFPPKLGNRVNRSKIGSVLSDPDLNRPIPIWIVRFCLLC